MLSPLFAQRGDWRLRARCVLSNKPPQCSRPSLIVCTLRPLATWYVRRDCHLKGDKTFCCERDSKGVKKQNICSAVKWGFCLIFDICMCDVRCDECVCMCLQSFVAEFIMCYLITRVLILHAKAPCISNVFSKCNFLPHFVRYAHTYIDFVLSY